MISTDLQHLDVAAQAVEIPGFLSRVGQQPTQSGIEYAFGERRFAAATHARDAGHDAERYLDVDIPEVVLPRAADRYAAASAARDGRRLYDAPPRQIVGREALLRLEEFRRRTAEDYLAAVLARLGANVD